MKQPKVSVIMPVYNTAPYLDAAIQSVLNQKLEDFELIIVNDGSTDGSLDVLKKWNAKDDRIRVISQDNSGPSKTRNMGLSLARGTYIYFMDSDDLIRSDTLSSCYHFCQEHDVEFVFFDAQVFSDDIQDNALIKSFNYNRKKTTPFKITTGREAFKQLLKTNEFFASPCLFFVSRNLINRQDIHFKEGIVHEDELFTSLLYLYAQSSAYIPEYFFSRRLRPNSIMTNPYSLHNIQSYFVVGQCLLSYASKYNNDKEIINIYLSKMMNAAVWRAHTMRLMDRLKIFFECLFYWMPYIQLKTLLALLFKKYKLSR